MNKSLCHLRAFNCPAFRVPRTFQGRYFLGRRSAQNSLSMGLQSIVGGNTRLFIGLRAASCTLRSRGQAVAFGMWPSWALTTAQKISSAFNSSQNRVAVNHRLGWLCFARRALLRFEGRSDHTFDYLKELLCLKRLVTRAKGRDAAPRA